MIKYNIIFVTFSLVFIGCATLKSQIQNDPNFEGPTGDRVSLSIRDKEGKDLSESMAGKVVLSEAAKWVKSKGFRVADETKKADQSIIFGMDQESKQVYVPAQAYSVPVYGNNNGSTTTVKGSYGQTLGTLETAPSNPYAPTGYQTQYREGYTANVTDRWLFMTIYSQVHGKTPSKISEGQVYPDQRDQEFFENRQVMSQAVSKLLSQSPLAIAGRAPASTESGKDPGCWMRLGILFDEKEKLDKGAKIKDFAQGSKAEAAGLKIGDIIYSIGGQDIPINRPVKFDEGKIVSVIGSRNGKDLRVQAFPSLQCIED
jgi:hypothetical protein